MRKSDLLSKRNFACWRAGYDGEVCGLAKDTGGDVRFDDEANKNEWLKTLKISRSQIFLEYSSL